MPFPGHKSYGQMGPKNKKKKKSKYVVGPSGHSYNPARVRGMMKRKTKA